MLIKEKNSFNILVIFLILHLIIWTLIPSFSNTNLPLDLIEALAWGSELQFGYNKHPPLSAWFPEFFYRIFGNQDWAYYLLSQLFVLSSFIIVWKFSLDFFKNPIHSLIAVLLLESIYFYNFTTPEFNVNVCQLPFWALTVYFCWKGIKKNDYTSWLLFGLFGAFGVLSKYLFIYLLVSIDVLFIYLIINKKFNFKCLISLLPFFLVLVPHFIWLADNNYITIHYAIKRTGLENSDLLHHVYYPFIFLAKQIGILIPFFLVLIFTISKLKTKINFKDKKLVFLICVNFVPILLMLLTSVFMGAKIRTMWMTPFYLFFGVLFIYILQKRIVIKKLKYFFSIFFFLFIFYPSIYLYISITQTDKRTDYPGKKISLTVQEKWNYNFSNEIGLVGGNEWQAGNLSYHLKSRPKWDNIFENDKNFMPKNTDDGFILIGDTNILSEICTGVFIEVEKQGICMIGKKK